MPHTPGTACLLAIRTVIVIYGTIEQQAAKQSAPRCRSQGGPCQLPTCRCRPAVGTASAPCQRVSQISIRQMRSWRTRWQPGVCRSHSAPQFGPAGLGPLWDRLLRGAALRAVRGTGQWGRNLWACRLARLACAVGKCVHYKLGVIQKLATRTDYMYGRHNTTLLTRMPARWEEEVGGWTKLGPRVCNV